MKILKKSQKSTAFWVHVLVRIFIVVFSKMSSRHTIRVSNGYDSDQGRHSVGLDLGPNRLQDQQQQKNHCRLAKRLNGLNAG